MPQTFTSDLDPYWKERKLQNLTEMLVRFRQQRQDKKARERQQASSRASMAFESVMKGGVDPNSATVTSAIAELKKHDAFAAGNLTDQLNVQRGQTSRHKKIYDDADEMMKAQAFFKMDPDLGSAMNDVVQGLPAGEQFRFMGETGYQPPDPQADQKAFDARRKTALSTLASRAQAKRLQDSEARMKEQAEEAERQHLVSESRSERGLQETIAAGEAKRAKDAITESEEALEADALFEAKKRDYELYLKTVPLGDRKANPYTEEVLTKSEAKAKVREQYAEQEKVERAEQLAPEVMAAIKQSPPALQEWFADELRTVGEGELPALLEAVMIELQRAAQQQSMEAAGAVRTVGPSGGI